MFKDEPARQCAGEDDRHKYCTVCDTKYTNYKKYCPECTADTYYFKRCTNCAEPGKETCRSHGGTHVMTKMDSDMAKAGSMTNGLTMPTILLCNEKCAMSDYCEYFEVLVDEKKFGSVYPRCLPEQMMYDAIVTQFNKEYVLDGVADQIMLDSLAMSIVRRERGRRIVSASGELTERVKSMPDGSFETWFEANAISGIIDSLDRRIQAWLKELNVTKAAREGSVSTKNINLINMLSSEDTSKIEDKVIDVVLEDEIN